MIARHRGFGLVEIMIGMMVGLVSMIVVMQVYTVFENQKRATSTGGDAQTNGALALYLMEREVRAAGNGMTEGEPHKYPPLAGCTTRLFDSQAAFLAPNATPPFVSTVVGAGTVSSVRLAPVVISNGVGGLSDSLTITYGTSVIAAPYTLDSAGYLPGGISINLTPNAMGIAKNDLLALVEEDPALSINNGNYRTPKPCSLLQVTSAPVVGAIPVADGTRYNKTGGTGVTPFTGEARLYDLGQLNLVTYRISGNNLVADVSKFGVIPDGTANGASVQNRTDFSPLASSIVNMQVQYGVDTGNAGTGYLATCKTVTAGSPLGANDPDAVIDAWVDATGQWENNGVSTPSLFNLQRIRAVRIGLVARSGVKASGTASDPCNTGAVTIHWPSGPDMTPNLSGDADWQCYRYKVFQTTIPVRNTLWSSTINPASTASCGARDPS